jgi:hypothetical protein
MRSRGIATKVVQIVDIERRIKDAWCGIPWHYLPRVDGTIFWLAGRSARSDFCVAPCSSTLHILLFHIADDGLPTIVYMDVLDTDKLLAAVTQSSKNLNLHCISP